MCSRHEVLLRRTQKVAREPFLWCQDLKLTHLTPRVSVPQATARLKGNAEQPTVRITWTPSQSLTTVTPGKMHSNVGPCCPAKRPSGSSRHSTMNFLCHLPAVTVSVAGGWRREVITALTLQNGNGEITESLTPAKRRDAQYLVLMAVLKLQCFLPLLKKVQCSKRDERVPFPAP